VKYSDTGTPPGYVCGECGVTGCKLWREFNATRVELKCCKCVSSWEGISGDAIDIRGFRRDSFGTKTDTIGWWVPAVPTEDETAWWGYSSVPDEAVRWWRTLPTK